ncbi:MAG: prepilin-type N-terminal cleavage/methylation domain-containing protein [Thermodesulfobacteriota bacterium]
MTERSTAAGRKAPVSGAGFTLIEIMVVLTLIAILASIAVPLYRNSVVKAREAALLENLYRMREAIDKYYADMDEYPPSLSELVEKKYIRTVPEDPVTKSSDTWVEVPAEEGSGVYDVHSGSELVGRSGTPYSEW